MKPTHSPMAAPINPPLERAARRCCFRRQRGALEHPERGDGLIAGVIFLDRA